MKKWLTFVLLLVLNISVFADEITIPQQPLLDKVTFQLSARQWVSTQTALLHVEINATLSGGDIVQMRKEIMTRLQQIAKGDWHITRFDRSQDTSGLEKLYVQAEIRTAQDTLTNIYADAKKISKPGLNYAITSVEFQPGLEDMQQARLALRQQLYQKVNEEIDRINAAYGQQRYTLNRLEFSEGNVAPVAMPRQAKMMSVAASMPASADMSVSNELILTAWAEVASNRTKGN